MNHGRVFDDNQAVWLVGAPPSPPPSPLTRDLTVDVAIIGGGFTGVSTAYHLGRRFPQLGVALLEARRLGNGASGRNGGMMLNGITPSEAPDTVAREHAVTSEAMDALEALIREHQLAVRYRRGGCLKLCITARAAEEAHAHVEQLAARGLPLRFVRGAELTSRLRVAGVAGAVLDPTEGVLNGIDLIRAMRPLLDAQGVHVHEDTPVTRIREGKTVELATPGGTVRARAIVLATSAYTPQLGYFGSGILPVISHVVATAPLPRAVLDRTGLGGLSGFSDDSPRVAYATVDPAGRLTFGGGTTRAYAYQYGNATARATGAAEVAVLLRTLTDFLPDLGDVTVEHRWSGAVDLTLSRHCAIGVRGAHDNVYYALGYSGHGVVLANLAGRVLTDLYAGHHEPWRTQPFYMQRPSGIPPEPLRWLGYQVISRLTGRSPWRRVDP